MPSYQLKFGKELEALEIEEKNLLGVLYPNELPSVSDQLEEVRRALKNPIESKPLHEMIKPGNKVVVMVSDITRPSPSKILLPPILEELDKIGVPDGQVTIVFGMGIHRNHTEEEKCQLVGEDIYRRYRCVDSTESDDYVSYGTTVRGTPIKPPFHRSTPCPAADGRIGNRTFRC